MFRTILLMFTVKGLSKLASNSIVKLLSILTLLLVLSLTCLPDLEGWSTSDILWWFPVTITTVGYGDLAPSSVAGRVIGLIVMFCGIGLASLIFGSIASKIIDKHTQTRKGESKLKLDDHIVILGWQPDKIPEMVEEILSDTNRVPRDIVLCSEQLEENPLPDQVKFVKGSITSHDLMNKACVAQATKIIVYGETDSDTILATLAVDAINREATVVAYIRKEENRQHINRINVDNGNISAVVPCSIPLIVQEIQDPGVSTILLNLLSNKTDRTIYKTEIPISIDVESLSSILLTFEATLFGIRQNKFPHDLHIIPIKRDLIVTKDSDLYIIAAKRPNLNWKGAKYVK